VRVLKNVESDVGLGESEMVSGGANCHLLRLRLPVSIELGSKARQDAPGGTRSEALP
jgi:hypothetical protein